MFKFSAVSQIWKKYIQKLNDWDLPLIKITISINFKDRKILGSQNAMIKPKSKMVFFTNILIHFV